jgi:hypothetical protein
VVHRYLLDEIYLAARWAGQGRVCSGDLRHLGLSEELSPAVWASNLEMVGVGHKSGAAVWAL